MSTTGRLFMRHRVPPRPITAPTLGSQVKVPAMRSYSSSVAPYPSVPLTCACSTSVRRSTVAVVSPGGMPLRWLPWPPEPEPSATTATVAIAASVIVASAAMRTRRRRGAGSPEGRPSSANVERSADAGLARRSLSARAGAIDSLARGQAERGATSLARGRAGRRSRGGAAAWSRPRAGRTSRLAESGQEAFAGFLRGFHHLRIGAVDLERAAAGPVRRGDVDPVFAHAFREGDDLLFVVLRRARVRFRARAAAGGERQAGQRARDERDGLGGE